MLRLIGGLGFVICGILLYCVEGLPETVGLCVSRDAVLRLTGVSCGVGLVLLMSFLLQWRAARAAGLSPWSSRSHKAVSLQEVIRLQAIQFKRAEANGHGAVGGTSNLAGPASGQSTEQGKRPPSAHA